MEHERKVFRMQKNSLSMISLAADKNAPGELFHHFWNECVGAGRAYEGLRADWQEQLERSVKACGFKRLRFHGLFHDDMFTCRRAADGTLQFNWMYVDALFDRMLAMGIRPFIELAFTPGCMTKRPETWFWWRAHNVPPDDLREWALLVRKLVLHLLERYGEEEVVQWYFEVWNEPNLRFFFKGTRSEYFDLYRVSAETIKAVHPRIKVGGPATSNFVFDKRFDGESCLPESEIHYPGEEEDLSQYQWKPVWIKEFLAYCEQNHVPVDFISTHPYPSTSAIDADGVPKGRNRPVNATPDDLRQLRKLVDESHFPNLEIHLTEWCTSSAYGDCSHDHVTGACFIIRSILNSIGLVDSLAYWVFTDIFEEKGAGFGIWHGGFGLMTTNGIPKPAWHAYRFLNALGTFMVARTDEAVLTRKANGKIVALLWNYPENEVPLAAPVLRDPEKAASLTETGSDKQAELTIAGFAPHTRFKVETLNREHGDAAVLFRAMGSPMEPSREAVDLLRKAAEPMVSMISADERGTLKIRDRIRPWEIRLIEEM